MMPLTARFIAHAIGGQVISGDPTTTFTSVTTDSRAPAAGALFVALVGPRFDGHDFVHAAVDLGAAGAIVAARHVTEGGRLASVGSAVIIAVPDTQRGLEDLGRAIRLQHPGRFIAITGSVGKTTIKDMVSAALRPFGDVTATPGNLNNHIGLPLTLARTRGTEAHVVLELGMSAAGEIAHLASIARPDVAVVCAAAAAHLANFDSVDGIADAKCELFEHRAPASVAVANAADARIVARARRIVPEGLVTWGADATVRVVAARHVLGPAGVGLSVALSVNGAPLAIDLQAIGQHNAANAAAAMAVVHALGLDLDAAAAVLGANFRAPHRRLQQHAVGDVVVVDDAYNANPTSMRASFATIAAMKAELGTDPRVILILGTMHELGPESPAMHRAVSEAAASLAPALVVGTGPEAAALTSAIATDRAIATGDVADAIPAILAAVRAEPGPTLVLLKGSRAERLERALAPILSAAAETQHLEGGA